MHPPIATTPVRPGPVTTASRAGRNSRILGIGFRGIRYLAAWLPLVGLYSLLIFNAGVAPNPFYAFAFATIYLFPAMALGPLVILLAQWLADRRFTWRSWPWLGIHSSAAVAYTWIWHGLFYGFLWLEGGAPLVQQVGGQTWSWEVAQGVFVYGLIAGFASAIRTNHRLNERETAAARADALRVRAEMQALRGQLDPHFLFNTLHSITALVRTDPARAEDALVQFGTLLRRVLDWKRDGTDEVPLAEEMQFIDGCLALEQIRLGDRLRVEHEISPAARECYIPVFSVQPLVENAIRHAVASQRAGGVIRISAATEDDRLRIVVADDGPGADPTAVARTNGTGLGAIRQRLQLRHGEAGTLAVDTRPGRGFAVTLALPVVTEPVLDAVG